MKYLKRFNEELEPRTYRRASKRLLDKGHVKRAEELKDWANTREMDETKKKWLSSVDEFSKFGTYQIDIKGTEHNEFSGDFHLGLVLDREAFVYNFPGVDETGNFWIAINCIPANEEVYNKCITNELDMYNGGFWGSAIYINFMVDDVELKIKEFNIESYDGETTMSMSNRKSANNFRKLLIDMFSNRELKYPSSYTDLKDFWELIYGYFGANIGLFTDYGFEPTDIADFFKNNTSVNDFYSN